MTREGRVLSRCTVYRQMLLIEVGRHDRCCMWGLTKIGAESNQLCHGPATVGFIGAERESGEQRSGQTAYKTGDQGCKYCGRARGSKDVDGACFPASQIGFDQKW